MVSYKALLFTTLLPSDVLDGILLRLTGGNVGSTGQRRKDVSSILEQLKGRYSQAGLWQQ